ncbi:hypothetical protein HU733_13990 [Pseudomonas paralactis]|nr:hypothetical protein [Pseudomonas paralactis]
MSLPLKELAKLNQILQRIHVGQFDANDVDNLLMKLRPYARRDGVFSEVAHYVAHSDARNRGLAHQSITSYVESIQFLQEYIFPKRVLDIEKPFPAYIHRVFISQARLCDERRLKAEYKMSRSTLIKKLKSDFLVDTEAGTCVLKVGKGGVELTSAIQFITGFLHGKAAFHIRDFHEELKELMRSLRIGFDEDAWGKQTDRISLAILCLISNTEFLLGNGSRAICKLVAENHFRLLSGKRRMLSGEVTDWPSDFGRLMIRGEAIVHSANKEPVRMEFPVIETELDPHEHCDPMMFMRGNEPNEFGDCEVEVINFSRDMSLSASFKVVRTDSVI